MHVSVIAVGADNLSGCKDGLVRRLSPTLFFKGFQYEKLRLCRDLNCVADVVEFSISENLVENFNCGLKCKALYLRFQT